MMIRLFRFASLTIFVPLLTVCSQKTDAATAPSNVDPRLKVFAEQKHRQTEQLAAKLRMKIPKDWHEFFRSAEAGDFQKIYEVEQAYLRTRSLGPNAIDPNRQTAAFIPMDETLGAFAAFSFWDPAMLQKFTDGILQSIPPGSIYFGGTDPGRFVITAIRDTTKSPDIFILTQNALADSKYMEYLRLVYGDRLTLPSIPAVQDIFQQYVEDAKKQPPRPDVDITATNHPLLVTSVAGVMAINAKLAQKIFEMNKARHEFYVEESYVLEWMYPYMKPHGLLLKLEKEPIQELDPAAIEKDRRFWNTLASELMADPHFLNNNEARKMFSKLRSGIGGLYAYRKLMVEAEAAYKQARELCPSAPEANFRLSQLYVETRRFDEAIGLVEKLMSNPDPMWKGAIHHDHLVQAIEKIRTLKRKAEEKQSQPPAN